MLILQKEGVLTIMIDRNKQYFVGIDLGTSSAKTAVFDRSGELLGCKKCSYETYSPKPGIVLQKEEEVLEAVYHSCKSAIQQANIPPESIASVSFSARK